MTARSGFVVGLVLGVIASGLLVSAVELLVPVARLALVKLQAFGEWLDSPAGDQWAAAGMLWAAFIFFLCGGARRG